MAINLLSRLIERLKLSDLYSNLYQSSWWWAPLFALAIGAAGSLHCVGMCGGLSLAVSKNTKDTFLYNIGRLTGYLSLAAAFSILGVSLSSFDIKKNMALYGGLFIGLALLWIGILAIRGREPKINSKLAEKTYSKVFRKFSRISKFKHFGIGASSIILPCGLSHAFILAALSLGDWKWAMSLVVFFWLGTMPAMTFGPNWTRSLFSKLGLRTQRLAGILFVLAGFLTLYLKIYEVFSGEPLCFS